MQHSSSLPARFSLTGAQQDIWLDQLRVGESPLYNIAATWILPAPSSPNACSMLSHCWWPATMHSAPNCTPTPRACLGK
ncbi:MAG: hypothetical protein GXW93_22455 [Pseudomonas lactis]|nr:hypothetical protein [Pseudomonas lactis]